ncbi:hypothetical protein [Bdellovibrio sp.]|uniref:hypothetical protein n=1 Tax=Bdellovibrio sp. TaxID=28201 RepID=UPI003221F34C|nr:hypothetical protein HAGR004_15560 [Bdellovibrio sp. HAGR004]
MQLAMSGIFPEITEKRTSAKNIVLTERDFEILEFIMDMKFAGVEEVFEKFFKITLTNESAKSSEWARKRLCQLEKANFLKSMRSFSESTRYYVTTFKAYYALSQFNPEKFVSKPSGGFDQRTFLHDRGVLRARLYLESLRKVNSWISDRKLKSSTELAGGLTVQYIPDAIYVTSASVRVAFELEIAVKAKSRYQDKIKKYVQLMRSTNMQHKVFDRVQFVCAKDTVAKFLLKETRIYGELFEVVTVEDFFFRNDEVKHEEA